MSYGFSPKLPLTIDPADGYALNKNYQELIAQNVKMLILTAPGERIMDPFFGVGLRNFLFENKTELTFENIRSKIREQIGIYLPFVVINEIEIVDFNPGFPNDGIKLTLNYEVPPVEVVDSLEFAIGNDNS